MLLSKLLFPNNLVSGWLVEVYDFCFDAAPGENREDLGRANPFP